MIRCDDMQIKEDNNNVTVNDLGVLEMAMETGSKEISWI